MSKATLILGSLAALLSGKALAHYPTLDCQLEHQEITCLAGYSDGSVAYEEPVQVFSYNDDLIATLTTDSNGNIHLAPPNGEYYLVFDPGHESPAEFDYAEF